MWDAGTDLAHFFAVRMTAGLLWREPVLEIGR
jgi:hypothetical protein